MNTKKTIIYLMFALFASFPLFAEAQCNANNLPLPPTYTWTATGPNELTISWDAQPNVPFWQLFFRVKMCDGIWEPFPTQSLPGTATSFVFDITGMEIFTSFIKPTCTPDGIGGLGQTSITPSDQNHWVFLDCDPCPNFTIIPLCGWSNVPNFPSMCSDFCSDEITHLAMLIEQTNPPGPIALNGTTWRGANMDGEIIWHDNNGNQTNPLSNGMTLELASMNWTVDDVSFATVDFFNNGDLCIVEMPNWNCLLGPGDGQKNRKASNADLFKSDWTTEVVVAPNPVTNYLNITVPDYLVVNHMEIIDASGKVIKTMNEKVRRINFDEFAQGVYFINIISNDSNIVKRIIKR